MLQTSLFGGKLSILPLNMKEFLRWAWKGETAASQMVIVVLKDTAEKRRVATCASTSETSEAPPLREAGAEQVR